MNVDLMVVVEGSGGWKGKWRNQSLLMAVLKDSRKERIHMYGRTLLSGPKYIIFTYILWIIVFGYRLVEKIPVS